MENVGALMLAYLLGSIPTGFLATRLVTGRDLRTVGSGGTGATNTARALGMGWGVVVLVVDLLKGVAAVLIARALSDNELVVALAGVIATAAHCWPVWLGFRGGKGVATGAGAAFALTLWGVLLAPILVIPVVLTRYVSLGSIVAAASAPFLFGLLWLLDLTPGEYVVFAVIAGAIIVGRHHANIDRLRSGTERRLGGSREGATAA